MKSCRSIYLSTLVRMFSGNACKYGFMEVVGVMEIKVGKYSSIV